MFELIVASKAHLEGTWYGNTWLTDSTSNGDVFKYKADKRYVELHDALDEVMEIVKDAKRIGVNIDDIQIKKTC